MGHGFAARVFLACILLERARASTRDVVPVVKPRLLTEDGSTVLGADEQGVLLHREHVDLELELPAGVNVRIHCWRNDFMAAPDFQSHRRQGDNVQVAMAGENCFYLCLGDQNDRAVATFQTCGQVLEGRFDDGAEEFQMRRAEGAELKVSERPSEIVSLAESPDADGVTDEIQDDDGTSSISGTGQPFSNTQLVHEGALLRIVQLWVVISPNTVISDHEVLEAVNAAQAYYQDPFMMSNVMLQVVRITQVDFDEANTPYADILQGADSGSAADRLSAFSRWQSRLRWNHDSRPIPDGFVPLYDHAIWFTPTVMTANGGFAAGVTNFQSMCGRIYSGTTCRYPAGSSQVVARNGLFSGAYSGTMLGVVVAHELGHNFGMPHDGEGNNCPSTGFIMAPSAGSSVRFSTCSRTYFLQSISSDNSFICTLENHTLPNSSAADQAPAWGDWVDVSSCWPQCGEEGMNLQARPCIGGFGTHYCEGLQYQRVTCQNPPDTPGCSAAYFDPLVQNVNSWSATQGHWVTWPPAQSLHTIYTIDEVCAERCISGKTDPENASAPLDITIGLGGKACTQFAAFCTCGRFTTNCRCHFGAGGISVGASSPSGFWHYREVLDEYTCSSGKMWSIMLDRCEDINECALGTDNCAANAACTNGDGYFTCTCSDGYIGNGVRCRSIHDPVLKFDKVVRDYSGSSFSMGWGSNGIKHTLSISCTQGSCPIVDYDPPLVKDLPSWCAVRCLNLTWTNAQFGPLGQCKQIYIPRQPYTSTSCDFVFQGSISTSPVLPDDDHSKNVYAAKLTLKDEYRCASGYVQELTFDGSSYSLACVDRDECEERSHDCAGTCTNDVGSFRCECAAGFIGNGVVCRPDTDPITFFDKTIKDPSSNSFSMRYPRIWKSYQFSCSRGVCNGVQFTTQVPDWPSFAALLCLNETWTKEQWPAQGQCKQVNLQNKPWSSATIVFAFQGKFSASPMVADADYTKVDEYPVFLTLRSEWKNYECPNGDARQLILDGGRYSLCRLSATTTTPVPQATVAFQVNLEVSNPQAFVEDPLAKQGMVSSIASAAKVPESWVEVELSVANGSAASGTLRMRRLVSGGVIVDYTIVVPFDAGDVEATPSRIQGSLASLDAGSLSTTISEQVKQLTDSRGTSTYEVVVESLSPPVLATQTSTTMTITETTTWTNASTTATTTVTTDGIFIGQSRRPVLLFAWIPGMAAIGLWAS